MTHWLLMTTPDGGRVVSLDLEVYRDMARQVPHVNCRCVTDALGWPDWRPIYD